MLFVCFGFKKEEEETLLGSDVAAMNTAQLKEALKSRLGLVGCLVVWLFVVCLFVSCLLNCFDYFECNNRKEDTTTTAEKENANEKGKGKRTADR